MIATFYEFNPDGTTLEVSASRTTRAGYVYLREGSDDSSVNGIDVDAEEISAPFVGGTASLNVLPIVYSGEIVSNRGSKSRNYDFRSASGTFNAHDYKITQIENITSASYARTSTSASYAPGSPSISASYAVSASYALNGGTGGGTSLNTGSTYPITSSWSNNSVSSSYAKTASYFTNGQSSINGTGDSHFQTLDVASHFDIDATGQLNSDAGAFFSTLVTANAGVSASANVAVGFYGTASNAISASYAPSTGTSLTTGSTYPITSSFAVSSSYALSSSFASTSSLAKISVSASITDIGNPNAEYNVLFHDGSKVLLTNGGGTSALSINPGTFTIKAGVFNGVLTGSSFGTASNSVSSSYAVSASYAPSSGGGTSLTTGSTYPITSSYSVTASNANSASNAVSASWALTASGAPNYVRKIGDTMTGTLNMSANVVLQTAQMVELVTGAYVLWDTAFSASAGNASLLTFSNPYGSVYLSASNAGGVVSSSLFLGNLTGSHNGTSSFSVSSSYAISSSVANSASVAISASWAPAGPTSLTTGSSYPITSSWSTNALTASTATSASLAQTASFVTNYQSYVTEVTSATNWITVSFASPNHQVNITTAHVYSWSSSNTPTVAGQCADAIIYISQSAAATSSFVWPAQWKNVGGTWPSAISASTNAVVWLRAIDTNQVIGTYVSSQ